jgi:excisionase family DNA binding protein
MTAALLDLDEVSRALGVSADRITAIAHTTRLPFAFTAGRGLLVDSRDLDQWRAAVNRACDGC